MFKKKPLEDFGSLSRFFEMMPTLEAQTLKVFPADSGDVLQDCLASHDDGSRGKPLGSLRAAGGRTGIAANENGAPESAPCL